jgi:LCP family protein required for cell wall assembly
VLPGCAVVLIAMATAGYFFVYVPAQHVTQAVSRIFQTPVPVRPAPPTTAPDYPKPQVVPGSVATPSPVQVRFPDWSKQEPVNVLLIGLDARTTDVAPLADTQVIVHIDPANKTAALVSIPRDLWVDIPGYGQDRVNSAYQLGALHQDTVPGGGPGLAMATIEQDFGVPINYYAQVNFEGFQAIVDTLGGITVDVQRPIMDNSYPFGDYGLTRIYVPAGVQHMDGKTALEYARSRHADSDIARNTRQRDVLMAIRESALDPSVLTHLSDLADQLANSVRTDLSLVQVGSLLQLSREIPKGSIASVAIGVTATDEVILPSGADVLMPRWEVIRPLIAQAFADPRLGQEAARIAVQNGTVVDGEGRKIRDLLVAMGLYVPDLTTAPSRGRYPVTTITDYTEGQKPRTVEYIAQLLGIAPTDVKQAPRSQAPLDQLDGKPVDILVIAGNDRLAR